MKPRHFAAIYYAILAIYFWASWSLLLLPHERAIGQLEVIFAPNYEYRTFFIFFAIIPFIVTALSIAFCFQRANLVPLANWLAVVSVVCFVVAIWLFDTSLILSFGFGCACAVYSRFTPNSSFKRDA